MEDKDLEVYYVTEINKLEKQKKKYKRLSKIGLILVGSFALAGSVVLALPTALLSYVCTLGYLYNADGSDQMQENYEKLLHKPYKRK